MQPTFRPVFVSGSDTQVQFVPNTANTYSTVYQYTVPAGQWVQLRNGALLVLNLRDANGALINAESKIRIGYMDPGAISPTWFAELAYMPWYRTPLAEQYNDMKNSQLRVPVSMRDRSGRPMAWLDRTKGKDILISVDSPDVIDVAQSQIELQVHQSPWIS